MLQYLSSICVMFWHMSNNLKVKKKVFTHDNNSVKVSFIASQHYAIKPSIVVIEDVTIGEYIKWWKCSYVPLLIYTAYLIKTIIWRWARFTVNVIFLNHWCLKHRTQKYMGWDERMHIYISTNQYLLTFYTSRMILVRQSITHYAWVFPKCLLH